LRYDLLFQMVENPVKARLHGLDSAAMTSNMHSHGRVKRFSIFIIALQPTEEGATHLLVHCIGYAKRFFVAKYKSFLCVSGAVPRSALLLVRIGIRMEDWPPTSPMTGLETLPQLPVAAPNSLLPFSGARMRVPHAGSKTWRRRLQLNGSRVKLI
jgi:hypothetical protein